MKPIFLSIIGLAACVMPAVAAPITHFDLENRSSDIERDIPVTFGAVFAPGDVPAGTSIAVTDKSGAQLPVQVDAKAKNKDGSLRHAVLTVVVPRLSSGREMGVMIVPGTPVQGAPITPAALPANLDARVDLNLVGGPHLTASLHDILARRKPETWLSGPLVGEWWVADSFRDPSGKPDLLLSVRFGIRSYGPNKPLRIEVDVENTWTWAPNPRTLAYSAEIRVGGKSVFTKDKLVQQSHSRWRQVFWWDKPVDVFVKPDLAYLKKTRVVPNYNPATTAMDVNGLYQAYQKKDRGPMGSGVIYPYMPTTGGRADIGPLPGWTVAYLLTMDERAAEMTMNAGDLGGSFQVHYRNEKTWRLATSEDFPTISTHYNYVGRGPGKLPLPNTAGLPQGFSPDTSHEPSLAFIPYLVTGERYYLEELQYWSQSNAWGTAPEYHGLEKGLIGWDQIRGQGWSLRTLAQAAYITPDADPMKGTLLRELKANAEWFDSTYTKNPNSNLFHFALRQNDSATAVAPWMDDFLTWAAQYTVELGFDEFRPFARWKAYSPVQRMINPDYCYQMATKYYIKVMDAPNHFIATWKKAYIENLPAEIRANPPACGSEELSKALKVRVGEMDGGAQFSGGYPSQMQPALAAAVDAGIPGAQEAWAKYKARPYAPKAVDAQWDIVPRNESH